MSRRDRDLDLLIERAARREREHDAGLVMGFLAVCGGAYVVMQYWQWLLGGSISILLLWALFKTLKEQN